ncbi:hypothetical protein ISN45_Aa04g026850 [Arabidopsis thaliana x Arabidopsis arenosa]|uniref:Uncharacterized protein n=1 Tax=Arabidopsis thaliana x Arabidopsis arenosa TaxID=1240361 RepID=A0A8T2AEP3_9BRAS|nr:hypothetical protein ISN45_Aa04g026850 [Arabidopsis thaliana x Arabidopsis arenosa]
MDKPASSKLIMNKEQLLWFVENKRKQDLPKEFHPPVETESYLELSMDKTESSKAIMSMEDCLLASNEIISAFIASQDKMMAEQDSAAGDGSTPSI